MNVRFDIRVVLMKIQVLWSDWYKLTFGRMHGFHYQIQVVQQYGMNLTPITWPTFIALN
jgi:predicted porin